MSNHHVTGKINFFSDVSFLNIFILLKKSLKMGFNVKIVFALNRQQKWDISVMCRRVSMRFLNYWITLKLKSLNANSKVPTVNVTHFVHFVG